MSRNSELQTFYLSVVFCFIVIDLAWAFFFLLLLKIGVSLIKSNGEDPLQTEAEEKSHNKRNDPELLFELEHVQV